MAASPTILAGPWVVPRIKSERATVGEAESRPEFGVWGQFGLVPCHLLGSSLLCPAAPCPLAGVFAPLGLPVASGT